MVVPQEKTGVAGVAMGGLTWHLLLAPSTNPPLCRLKYLTFLTTRLAPGLKPCTGGGSDKVHRGARNTGKHQEDKVFHGANFELSKNLSVVYNEQRHNGYHKPRKIEP